MSGCSPLRTTLLCAALVGGLPGVGRAQATPDSSRSVVLRNAEAERWYVRVRTDGGDQEGRVAEVRSDSVRLTGARIALQDIVSIERRAKEGGGAKAGALIGGLGLGGFSFLAVAALCDVNCGADYAWLGGGGMMVGGVLGGLIGQLLSPARVTWHPIWQETPRR